jgi:hypothetical protein
MPIVAIRQPVDQVKKKKAMPVEPKGVQRREELASAYMKQGPPSKRNAPTMRLRSMPPHL